MKKSIFITLLCACFSTMFYAQKEGLSVYGAGTFPVGECEKNGMSCGFDVGVKYQYDLPIKGLGAIATFDIMFNGIKREKREETIERWEDNFSSYDSHRVTTSKTLNFPIMFGVNYHYELNEQISFWGETALGLTIMQMTPEKFKGRRVVDYQSPQSDYHFSYKEIDYINVTSYKPVVNCAYQVGIGTLLWQRISVGFHFYVFGGEDTMDMSQEGITKTFQRYRTGKNSSVKTDRDTSSTGKMEYAVPIPTQLMLSLRIGYHF